MTDLDTRLEFLRTVAHQNEIPVPSPYKRAGYTRPPRKHKPTRQLFTDETKRIRLRLQETNGNTKVTHASVAAPPSLRPLRKYCDITGLAARYRSPTNNLRFHNAEVFQLVVKPMGPGADQEYLKLRGDNFVLK